MTKKFHISKAGKAEPCGATVRACPRGGVSGEENHFGTLTEAVQFAASNDFHDTEHRSESENVPSWKQEQDLSDTAWEIASNEVSYRDLEDPGDEIAGELSAYLQEHADEWNTAEESDLYEEVIDRFFAREFNADTHAEKLRQRERESFDAYDYYDGFKNELEDGSRFYQRSASRETHYEVWRDRGAFAFAYHEDAEEFFKAQLAKELQDTGLPTGDWSPSLLITRVEDDGPYDGVVSLSTEALTRKMDERGYDAATQHKVRNAWVASLMDTFTAVDEGELSSFELSRM